MHIDIAEVRIKERTLYLLLAIDRTSKLALAKMETEANRYTPTVITQALARVGFR
ncbi:hypothetical protein [Methylobacterium pseudosasicola]|uniref:hypothetical protein n=1 Tax=Methylobacterium pseudosasicola TaxID=582667 RepID=UPI003CC7AC56